MKTLTLLTGMIFSLGFLSAQVPEKQILLHTQNDNLENLTAIDFNNDGWQDYLSISDVAGYLFENDGTDNWAARYILPGFVTDYLKQVFTNDVNGDGLTDIVVVEGSYSYSVSWFKNPGNVTDVWVKSLIASTMDFFIGLFDVDSDGDADLVYENSSSYLYWKENAGGVFTTLHAIPDSYPATRVVTVYDFDQDGDQDWAAYFYDCCTKYFENTGDGSFTVSTVSTDENQDDIYVGDADGDGYADIIVEDAFDFGVAIFDTIDGNFDLDIAWDYYTGTVDMQLSDIDNDGDNDWIIFENDPVSGYKNMKWIESSGAFVTLDDMNVLADSIPDDTEFYLLSDYNNDGQPDLLFNENQSIKIARNQLPENGFSTPFKPDTSYVRMDLMSSFDVDGDADNDLMVVSNDGKLAWFKYDAATDSFFSVHYLPNLEASPYPSALQHGDIDNDGDQDLLASFHSTGGGQQISYYFLNDGNGIFTTHEIDATAYNKFWLTDADADGDNDLIGMQYDDPHNLVLFLKYPDTSNLFIYTSIFTIGNWTTFEMMDADNDGDEDFIGAEVGSTYIKEIPNTDGATFFGPKANLFNTVCSTPASIFINDFDNDGDNDIAYACTTSGYAYLAVNTDGVFAPVYLGIYSGYALSELYFNDEADLNQDGFPDIVLSDYVKGTKVKLSAGGGSFDDDFILFSDDFGTFANVDGDSIIDFIGTNDLEFYLQHDINIIHPSFTMTSPSLTWLSENGASDGVSIVFNQIPSSELIIDITPSGSIDAGAGPGAPVAITFYPDSTSLVPHLILWNVPDDTIVEDVATNYVGITSDPETWGWFDGSIDELYNYTITDNDAGIFYSPVPTSVTEGGLVTIHVHVNIVPSSVSEFHIMPGAEVSLGLGAGVEISFNLDPDLGSIGDRVFTITVPNDYYYEPLHTSSIIGSFVSDDPLLNEFVPEEKVFNVNDNDIVNVTRAYSTTYRYEEGVDNFYISFTITTEPYSDVTIVATPDEQLDLGNGPGMPASIIFLADGIMAAYQDIMGVPVDDTIYEGDHTGTVSFEIVTDDPYYAEETLNTATIKIGDNDEESTAVEENTNAGLSVSPTMGNGVIQIDGADFSGDAVVSVINMTGEEVFSSSLKSSGINTIDLSWLTQGMYIIIMGDRNHIATGKIEIMK